MADVPLTISKTARDAALAALGLAGVRSIRSVTIHPAHMTVQTTRRDEHDRAIACDIDVCTATYEVAIASDTGPGGDD